MASRGLLVLKMGEPPPVVESAHGDFEDWIARSIGCGVDALTVVRVDAGEALPAADRHSGVIVTGSPSMVSDRADWSEASASWLREVVRADIVPVLGLCYGHQLLAHGLGGEVGPNPKGRNIGTVEVVFDGRDANVKSLPPLFERGVFPAHVSHSEVVLEPPSGTRVLARTAVDEHCVLAYGPRQWGVQFHPEFNAEIVRAYVDARRDALMSEGIDPDERIASVVETPRMTEVLRRFGSIMKEGG